MLPNKPPTTLKVHSLTPHNRVRKIKIHLRMWRNWQTRRSQKPVMVTSWRFKSSHPHQENQGRVPTNRTRLFVSGARPLGTASCTCLRAAFWTLRAPLQPTSDQNSDCSIKRKGERDPNWAISRLKCFKLRCSGRARHVHVCVVLYHRRNRKHQTQDEH